MKAPVMLRPAERPAFGTKDLRTTPLVGPDSGACTLFNGMSRLSPLAETPWHLHDCEESLVVLQGHACFEAGDLQWTLLPYDTMLVPSGCMHRYRNLSSQDDLVVLWMYEHQRATRTLGSTRQTRSMAAEQQRPT